MMEDLNKNIKLLEIREFKTSNSEDHFLVSCNDRNFEVNRPIAELIQSLQISGSIEEATERYSILRGKKFTKDYTEKLIQQCIIPTFFKNNKKEKTPFLFNIDLISAHSISFLTNKVKILFKPIILLLFISIALVFDFCFLIGFDHSFNLIDFNIYLLIGVIILFLCSTLIHEIGHAAACKYFNMSHGNIGFAIYLIIPVFYTDVSNAWKLPRNNRILINFAGIYFQLILLIPFFLVYYYTNNSLVKYFLFISNINFLITLNPIVKFDGYWILSDMLGIPNLREKTVEMISYMFKRLKKQEIVQKPSLTKIKFISKIIAIIYTIIVNIFFLYFFCYVIPDFFYKFFKTMPEYTSILLNNFANGNFPANLFYIVITKLITFGLIIYLVVRTITPIVKKLIRINDNRKK
jgi:putative peptide zinc metalloprotease protein